MWGSGEDGYDGWTDGWTAGQAESRVGQDGRRVRQDGGHGQEGQFGQVRRVGTGGQDWAARA